MNFAPSDFPRIAGAASLSKPGFDIIMAVSAARQATLPTPRLLRARTTHDSQTCRSAARRAMFAGSFVAARDLGAKPARFFDLPDEATVLPETMNSLFTRAFQPMLNPLPVDLRLPDAPCPGDEDME